MTTTERGSPPATILGLFGSTSNMDGGIEASVNPDAASMPKPSWGADTAEEILRSYDPNKKAARIGISSAVAKELAGGTADPALRAHCWPHWRVPPEIRAQGAADVHSAGMGGITNSESLAATFRDAYFRARALSPETPFCWSLASIASASGPSLAIIAAIISRQILNASSQGNESWQGLLALWPELTDGTDTDRLKARIAVAYACLRSLEALALATEGGAEPVIPGLGRLCESPYDEIQISFASLHGATSVEELLRASWLILSLIADRSRGVGKLMEADSIRRVGHQYQPRDLNGRRQALVFAVPRAFKVTLDRHALADRAARWATVVFLNQLLRSSTTPPATLYDRLLAEDALKISRLDPRGEDLLPQAIAWEPAKDVSSETPALRQITNQTSADAISRWDAGHAPILTEGVDQACSAAEAERLADSNLLALSAEYEELVRGLESRIRDLRGRGEGEAEQARNQFNAKIAAPFGSGRWTKVVPLGRLDAVGGLRTAALTHAQKSFRERRVEVLCGKLEEWKRHFEAGSGSATRDLIAEIAYQVSQQGLYRRTTLAGWERMRRPAPNVHCLYSSRPEFETIYYEARILEDRLPSGEIRVSPGGFRKAALALSREIHSAMVRGRGAFPPLVAAIESYFRPLFEEHWQRLCLSNIRSETLESALDDAIQRINPAGIIDRRSGKGSDYFYCELDGADPDSEWLESLVANRAPALGFRHERAVRSGESAIILFGLSSGLALDDIVPLRHDSEASNVFLDQLRQFHDGDSGAMPVFASRWFEELVATYDPEVAAIIHRSGGQVSGTKGNPQSGKGSANGYSREDRDEVAGNQQPRGGRQRGRRNRRRNG